jgi:hypothetical protein
MIITLFPKIEASEIILSEKNQSQKVTYYKNLFYNILKMTKL